MRILNLGAGEDTYGTDFIDINPTRKEVIKLDICSEKLPYKNDTFDKVYMQSSFEHLYNPLFTLRESHRVLKKNGLIHIQTDNANSWYLAYSTSHHGGLQFGSETNRHYMLLTQEHLKNWLEKAGFKDIKTDLIEDYTDLKPIKKLINWFFKITPLWRMSYIRVEAEGRK